MGFLRAALEGSHRVKLNAGLDGSRGKSSRAHLGFLSLSNGTYIDSGSISYHSDRCWGGETVGESYCLWSFVASYWGTWLATQMNRKLGVMGLLRSNLASELLVYQPICSSRCPVGTK